MTNLHIKAFKYSLPNLHKYSSPPRNSAKFHCNTWIYHGHLSFYNLAMFTDGKVRNMPKVSELCTEEVYNLDVSALKYSLPDLRKSVSPLKSCKIGSNA